MPPVVEDTGGARIELRLFGCWDLRVDGRGVELGRREQRLLALLALSGRRSRAYIAGTLWPDTTDKHAQESLRTAVLRSRQAVDDLLEAGRTTVALSLRVTVDVSELVRVAGAGVVNGHDARAVIAMM